MKKIKFNIVFTVLFSIILILGTSSFGQHLLFHLLANSAAPYTWTGLAGDNLWNSPNNWSSSQVPGASDLAKFNGDYCSGLNCNVTINVSPSVLGINISANFPGTITQSAAQTITLGTSGYVQAGGIFTGGNSAITSNGVFTLSGGTFTSTSGTFLQKGNFTVSGTPVFNHNSGTFSFTFTVGSITPSTINFNNVIHTGENYCTTTLTGTMNILGDLTLDSPVTAGNVFLNSGTVLLSKNLNILRNGVSGTATIKLVGTSNRTVTGATSTSLLPNFEIMTDAAAVTTFAGSMRFDDSYLYTSGIVDAITMTPSITFGLLGSINAGSAIDYYNVEIRVGSGGTKTITGSLNVKGLLTLYSGYSTSASSLNGGTINAYGNVASSSSGIYSGTVLVKVRGSTNQTISGVANSWFPNVEIASTGGVVTFSGFVNVRGNYLYSSGTIDAGTSTFTYNSDPSGSTSFTPGSLVNYNNVVINGGNGTTQTMTGTLNVLGTLTLYSYQINSILNSGTINAYGNVAFTGYGYNGSTVLNLLGSNSSTLNVGVAPNLSFSKTFTGVVNLSKDPTKKVTLTSDSTFAVGQNINVTSGILDLSGYDFTAKNVLSISAGASIICDGGEFFYGSLSNSGTLDCPGYAAYAFNWTGAGGNSNWSTPGNWSTGVVPGASDTASFSDTFCGANCNVTFDINPNVKGIFTIANYTGTMTQATALTVGSVGWKQYGGTFSGDSNAITIGGQLKIAAGTFNPGSSSILVRRSINLAGTGVINLSNTAFNIAPLSGSLISFNAGTTPFKDLTISSAGGQDNFNINLASNVSVVGNLVFNNLGATQIGLYYNRIDLQGNLTVTSSTVNIMGTTNIKMVGGASQNLVFNQTTSIFCPSLEFASTGGVIDITGLPRLGGSFVYTSGAFSASRPDFYFQFIWLSNRTTVTMKPGIFDFGNLTIANKPSWDYFLMNLTGDVTVNGNFTLTSTSSVAGSFAGAYTFFVKGNLNFDYTGAAAFDNTGTKVRLTGNTNQTINNTGSYERNYMIVEIASTGGVVTNNGILRISSGLNYISGTFAAPPDIKFMTYIASTVNVNTGAMNVGNVEFKTTTSNAVTFALASDMNITGTLTMSQTTSTAVAITGFKMKVSDNVSISNTGTSGYNGTTVVQLVGTKATHNISASITSGSFQLPFEISKTGGQAYLTSAFNNSTAGASAFKITTGTLNQSGYALTVAGTLTLASGTVLNRGGGALVYGGLSNSGTINL